MYRAIIVDDEAAVRQGLKNHFNWGQYGLQVAADFSDGEKAWEYLQSHPVDLVITDVRMPNMDGIALARHIREAFPRTQIIFISGYDDTEYLRKAFKMDVVDYILKSIDLDEFAQAIAHVTGRMEKEAQRQRRLSDLEEKLNESIPLLQQRGLMLLVSTDYEYAEISRERLRFLNIPLYDDVQYCVVVLQIRNLWRTFTGMNERQRQLFSLEMINRGQEVLREYDSSVMFENRLGEYVIFLKAETEEYENALLSVSQALNRIVEEEFQMECSIGISERFCGLAQAHSAYESAVNAIVSRYYLNETHSISVDKFRGVNLRAAWERAEKGISGALCSGEMDQVNTALEGVFETLKAMGSLQEQQNLLINLLLLPAKAMANVPPEEMGLYADQRKLMERFLCCRDIREQKLFISGAYEDAIAMANRRSESQPNYIVEKTCQIIEQSYMEQISIASLAEKVFLTPTYLCVLFKQATGQTLNEYITQVRMQHARTLLADSHIRLYDVCYQVGYLSPSYFSKIFKKYTHMTPSEYRDAHINRD